MAVPDPQKVLIQNRRAHHEYFIDETLEAGLVLYGTEVKSLRQGRANLRDSFITIKHGEVFVVGFHISPYEHGNIFNRDPLRDKKLLLNKAQIRKLQAQTMQKGAALVPLSVYFSGNYAKMKIGVGRGKKLYDKRETLKQKDDRREMERAFRERQKA